MNWAAPSGSLRRGRDLVDDLVLVVSADDVRGTAEIVASSSHIGRVRYRDDQHIAFDIDGADVTVHLRPAHGAGAFLLHLTGSPAHLDRLGAIASARGWRLDAEGLQSGDSQPFKATTEEEIYARLGLPFIAAELREDGEEVDLALADRLPSLITRDAIRGDLHMHTQWSDGRDSTRAMVEQCVALGYEYLAITDHSTHSAASRNLSLKDVSRQADEIAGLREEFPQIAILHGAEVDILADGRLDFSDRVLEKFDIVLASLHDRAGHAADALISRYELAMRHPLVSIITHPMNRAGAERPGYELDTDRLFALAAETGTVLEIDGAPSHLDLESSLARRAIRAGVTLSIDSDAHRTELLDRHMTLGLLLARHGWVEPEHVLNTRPHSELIDFLQRKRSR